MITLLKLANPLKQTTFDEEKSQLGAGKTLKANKFSIVDINVQSQELQRPMP